MLLQNTSKTSAAADTTTAVAGAIPGTATTGMTAKPGTTTATTDFLMATKQKKEYTRYPCLISHLFLTKVLRYIAHCTLHIVHFAQCTEDEIHECNKVSLHDIHVCTYK